MRTPPDKTTIVGRRIRRVVLLVLALAILYFCLRYGIYSVPSGMDTMPGYPPGTTCIIEKGPSSVRAGNVVILALPGGAGLLTKVLAVRDARITIRHDNRKSALLEYERQTFPMTVVRGLVLTGFVPDKPRRTGGK